MDTQMLFSQLAFLLEKSLGIWFVVWAIRRKFDLDYKLSSTAVLLRWAVVTFSYLLLATGVLGIAAVRLPILAVGLLFLCWPNFVYHLTKFFVQWPTIEGRIGSVLQDGSRSVVTYSFEVGQDSFGGKTTVSSESRRPYVAGERVEIAYDPLNPDESRLSRNPA
jgi:Protein of unknown function (DUF3592)